jgi:dTDP-4-dehydrorhamnose 3,5-epimerase
MKFTPLKIPDVFIVEPNIFEDERGAFYETYRKDLLEKHLGREIHFVQDNHSISKQGYIRGLHYQALPMQQDKLVRVIRGEVFDVAIDLRQKSPTYGQYVSEILSSKNRKQLFIPAGFAHGFLTLSPEAECCYKVTNYYSPENEGCLLWNDTKINIVWPYNLNAIHLSEKDKKGLTFNQIKLF